MRSKTIICSLQEKGKLTWWVILAQIFLLNLSFSAFSQVISDDFSTSTLNENLWTVVDPQGGAFVSLTGTQLSVTIPAGIEHDPWTTTSGGNTSTRLMQSISDQDFEIELKIESGLSEDKSYGLLVEASDDVFLRFDLYQNAGKTKIFSAFVDGASRDIKLNSNVTLASPVWLKVNRIGDNWTYSYSLNGQDWTQAVSFTEAITVSRAGFFAGNFGTTPEHTMLVDYFFNPASPIDPEDGVVDTTPPVISNINAVASSSGVVINWTTNEPASSRVDYGLTTSYTDFIENSVLLTDHGITIDGLDQNTDYHFQITSQDASENISTSPDITLTTDEIKYVVSDDFSASSFDTALWALQDPVGGAILDMTGSQVSISIPGGVSHDPWNGVNPATRIVQKISDLDFDIITKFESELSNEQSYGLMIKETDSRFMRFDLYHNGSLNIFAAYLDGNSSSIKLNSSVPITTPVWLRVNRSGNSWTYSYSQDSANWTDAVTFTQDIVVNEVGPYIGNFGASPAHTALIDYFFNAGSPIDHEDGPLIVTGPENTSIEENQTTVGTYTSNQVVNWSLNGTDASLFSITDGTLAFLANPDFEDPADGNGDNIYEIVIEATDTASNLGTLNVAVTVTDQDEIPPTISGDPTPVVAENQMTVGTYSSNEEVTWSIIGLDSALFSITAGGELVFLVVPDFENPGDDNEDNILEIVIEATDSSSNMSMLNVAVAVTDLDEVAPVVSGDQTASAVENQTTVATYSGDEDVNWSISGNDSAFFSINGSGDLAFLTAPDFEDPADINGDNIYEIVIEAIDSSSNVGTLNVDVIVTNLDEVAPEVSGDQAPLVEENQTTVDTYTSNKSAIWSISGIDSALFSINNGDLRFLVAPDYEAPADSNADNIYEVVVEATDTASNVDTLAVTVTIKDLDEDAPVISGYQSLSVEENQTAVTTYSSNEEATWSISGIDSALFSITGGDLAFLAAPDFENPADDNGDSIYEIVIEATDSSSNIGMLNVAVAVTDQDEVAPVVSGDQSPSVEENQTAVATYTSDEDEITWGISGIDSAVFSIIGGNLAFLAAPDYENPADTNGDNIYELMIEATDTASNVGSLNIMVTVADLDDAAPLISNIVVAVTSDSATISWSTDEIASGRIDYGLTSAYTDFIVNNSLVNDHVVIIGNLSTDTEYHYRISATDSTGNVSNTTGFTFSTFVGQVNSDDFSSSTLNDNVWTLEDPQGGASVSLTGTRLSLTIPSGIEHDPWITSSGGNTSTRLMQSVSDQDFEIELKLESGLSEDKSYGLLAEASDNTFLRFDLYFNAGKTKIFSAFVDGASRDIKLNSNVTLASPVWLKVNRTGDNWIYSYSLNGQDWTQAVSFSQVITVNQIGFFAGNFGTTPEHTMVVDYFFNTASPIIPEDNVSDTVPPLISNINVVPLPAGAEISWTSNEPASSRIDYGLTSSYDNFAENSSLSTDHSITVDGLDQDTQYHFKITSADGNDNEFSTSDDVFTTINDALGPNISIWYGDQQRVGHLGKPQDDFNVLGNVSDSSGVAYLEYTLNGQGPYPLTVGYDPSGFGDLRRLAANGDFNADILIDDLQPGINTIVLTAEDSVGNQSSDTLTVDLQTGSSTLPYSIDWSGITNAQNVGQYVDGLWSIEGDGIRTIQTGYDRLFQLGDSDWVDYEITVPITIHGIDPQGPKSGSAGIGLLMRFAGHVVGGHRNFPNAQPKWGYQPFGAIGWLRGSNNTNLKKQFYAGDYINTIDHGTYEITYGNTYWFKIRSETLPDNNGVGVTEYSWKIWEDNEAEPTDWDWQVVQESEYALRSGGPALIAHHIDATFGDVSIVIPEDLIDTIPPVISNINVNTNSSSATVSWTTDERVFGQIDYGLTPSYTDFVEGNASLDTAKSIQLSGLNPGITYHFQITSQDASGNISTSPDLTFITDEIRYVVSDDFSSGSFDTTLWELQDPVGGATLYMTGSQASISIPGGVSHDPWNGVNPATRIVQKISDVDFDIITKFESELSNEQSYGLMIKESDSRFLRFDLYHNGSLNIFAAYLDGNSNSIKLNSSAPINTPLWLRVNRAGNSWTYSYSVDSANWTNAVTFTQDIVVEEVGPYIGNFGSSPAHTALIDYFFNADSPIDPEDYPDENSSARTIAIAEEQTDIRGNSIGLDDPFQTEQIIKAYPNPFELYTTLKVSGYGGQAIKILTFDSSGKQVSQIFDGQISNSKEHLFRFDGRSLIPGLYFISIEGEGFSKRIRVLRK